MGTTSLGCESEAQQPLSDRLKKSPTVVAVILNWNGFGDTSNCIRSLLCSSYPNLEIVIVDNGSSKDEWEKLIRAFGNRVRLFRLESNSGFAAGSNFGIERARDIGADYVFLMNNDAEAKADCLSLLVSAAETHRGGGVFGPVIYDYNDRGRIQTAGGVVSVWRSMSFGDRKISLDKAEMDSACRTGWLSGTAILVRMSMLQQVGSFDPIYFAYLEETDLEIRAMRLGWSLYCVPNAAVYHKCASSTDALSRIRVNGMTRNRLIFLKRYATSSQILAFSAYYAVWGLPFGVAISVLKARTLSFSGLIAFARDLVEGLAGGVLAN